MPRLSMLVALFGVLAILLFTFYWVLKMMHWPGAGYCKLGAFVLGGLGLALMAIDYFIQRQNHTGREKPEWDGDENEEGKQ